MPKWLRRSRKNQSLQQDAPAGGAADPEVLKYSGQKWQGSSSGDVKQRNTSTNELRSHQEDKIVSAAIYSTRSETGPLVNRLTSADGGLGVSPGPEVVRSTTPSATEAQSIAEEQPSASASHPVESARPNSDNAVPTRTVPPFCPDADNSETGESSNLETRSHTSDGRRHRCISLFQVSTLRVYCERDF
jgi:hypothetical protein